MTDALEQADAGQAREDVVSQGLPDSKPLRGGGHPPLGLLGGEQIEDSACPRDCA